MKRTQNTPSTLHLGVLAALVLILGACQNFKTVELFEGGNPNPEPLNIDGFYALNILEDQLNGEVWFTENSLPGT